MISFTLNGLQLITSVSQGNYILQGIDGIEDPGRRFVSYELPGQDGGSVSSVLYGIRTVTLTGVVLAPDATTHQAKRKALAAVCAVTKNTNNRPVPISIAFTTLDGFQYVTSGHVSSFHNPLDRPTVSDFQIVLSCPDPVLYSLSAITTGQFSRPTGGGAIYPVTYPVTYSASTGGSASVTNAGNASSYPLITIRGVTTNPYIYCTNLGLGFQLNVTTVNVTDVIVIDMRNKTVMLNGTTSIIAFKTTTSSWYSLPPGTSNFTFSTGLSSDAGTVEVSATGSGYVGV